jgi:hypothetical protein
MVLNDRRRIDRGQDTVSVKARIKQSEIGNPEERWVSGQLFDWVGNQLSDRIISQ